MELFREASLQGYQLLTGPGGPLDTPMTGERTLGVAIAAAACLGIFLQDGLKEGAITKDQVGLMWLFLQRGVAKPCGLSAQEQCNIIMREEL